MKIFTGILSLTLFAACVLPTAQAQGHTLGAFAEFSAGNPGQGNGYIYGGSAGGWFQAHFVGLVLRGTALPSGSGIKVYNVLAGPRVMLDIPILKPYVEATGGMGHAAYYDVMGNYDNGWGPAWQVDAGVDHGLLPFLDWRIVEVGYGRIYVGPGVSTTVISTGVTLHL